MGSSLLSAIVAHSWVPGIIIHGLLGVLIIFLKDPATVDLQHLLAPIRARFFPMMRRMARNAAEFLSIFLFSGYIILMAIGFSATNPKKISFGKAFGTVVGVWLFYLSREGRSRRPRSPDRLAWMKFQFEVIATDPTGARLGRLTTPHGVIDTPAFMPVGTAATVKAQTQADLESLGVQILLSNTYHLFLRPGHELIRDMGGLHSFMSWPRAILTDSGGYQVFSLSELRKVTDEGITFRSHLDGSAHMLSPEKALEIEIALGADIIMVLDECIETPSTEQRAREAAARTLDWARRSQNYFQQHGDSAKQMLFGIVQGGTSPGSEARKRRCAGGAEFPGLCHRRTRGRRIS